MVFHLPTDRLPDYVDGTRTRVHDAHIEQMMGDRARQGYTDVARRFNFGNGGIMAVDADLSRTLGELEYMAENATAATKKNLGNRVQSAIARNLGDIARAEQSMTGQAMTQFSRQLNDHTQELSNFINQHLRAPNATTIAADVAGNLSHTHALGRAAHAPQNFSTALQYQVLDRVGGAVTGGAPGTAGNEAIRVRINGVNHDFHVTTGTLTAEQMAHNETKVSEALGSLGEWNREAHDLVKGRVDQYKERLSEAKTFLTSKAEEAASKTGIAAKPVRGAKVASSVASAESKAVQTAEQESVGMFGRLSQNFERTPIKTGAATLLGGAGLVIGGKALAQDIGLLEAPKGPDGLPEKGNFLMDAAITGAGIAGLMYAMRKGHAPSLSA